MEIVQRLKNRGAYASTFGKARKLVDTGGVLSCEVEPSAINGSVRLSGLVRASQPGSAYRVEVSLDLAEGDVVDYYCTCPVGDLSSGMCKHQVALALAFAEGAAGGSGLGESSGTGAGASSPVPAFQGTAGAGEPPARATPSGRLPSFAPPRPAYVAPTSPQITNLISTITAQRMRDASRHRASVDLAANSAPSAPTDPVDYQVALSPSDAAGYAADGERSWLLKLRVSSGKVAYIVKNVANVVRAYQTGDELSYGRRLSFAHTPDAFTANARKLLDVLARVVRSHQALFNSRWNYQSAGRGADVKELPLSDADVAELLDGQQGSTIEYDPGAYSALPARKLLVAEGDPDIRARLEQNGQGGYELMLPRELACIAASDDLYVLDADHAWHCSREYADAAGSILPRLLPASTPLQISARDVPEFCRSVLPALSACTAVDAPPELFSLVPPEPAFSFKIGLESGLVTCRARVAYGDVELDLYEPQRQGQPARDLVAEYHVQDVLEAYFSLVRGELTFDESDDDRLFDLLTDGLADLDALGEVILSERLRLIKVRPAPQMRVRATVEDGLLDVAIDSSGLAPADLRAYLASFKSRERFVRLSSGDIVKMGEDMRAVESLAEGLDADIVDLADGIDGLPQNRSLFVDALLKKASDKGAEQVRFDRGPGFRAIVREFETFSDADIEMPQSLNGVLRTYQVAGVRWLGTLERFGFGGILADDMGLGKTLQVIAHILGQKEASEKAAGKETAAGELAPEREASGEEAGSERTSASGRAVDAAASLSSSSQTTLIVAPASLVYNWMAELKRFAPKLKVAAVVGGKAARTRIIGKSAERDVLVTSYDLMKRDIEAYAGQRYRRVVLDEAQYIKNPGTRAAKCAKCLPADVHFALTGTPIENRLGELWSIFDFLMPGVLGTREEFAKKFEGPVEHGEFEATNRLQCLVSPFILRRVKSDVLSDLPEKTESVVFAQMGAEQQKLYRANQDRLAMQVQHRLPNEFKREKLKVLAELTKLRQICCDPRLCYDDYTGGSAKLDTCIELVRSAIDGGHAVLVFSQFTTMLDMLAERMKAEGMVYLQLTGATSKERRAQLVKEFQAGGAQVFLISLKAGGVGLNLTAADVVIHYDPWWNLAAQNQATDRAHRMGQERSVSVFKLIAKDTIEEKIVKMQERKHDLAEAVLGGEDLSSTRLSQADVLALLGA